MSRTEPARRVAVVLLLLATASACRQDMHNQPRAKPFAEADFFPDGRSARDPVAGTVARGQLRADRAYETGIGPDGTFLRELPVALTRESLARGRERFEIFCSPCHGLTGSGRGMIVQRGFKTPESYHTDRLRAQPIGYVFDVATNGFGQMSGYASQVPVADRWAIAAYVRTLQLSQHATADLLSATDRTAADDAGHAPAAPAVTGPRPSGAHR